MINFSLWNKFVSQISPFTQISSPQAINSFSLSITLYTSRSFLLWQEGLFIDFLQKKTSDRWLRSFVTTTSSLFNDKVVFELIYKFYFLFFIGFLKKFVLSDSEDISFIFNMFLFFLILSVLVLLSWNVFIGWVNYPLSLQF